MRELTMSETGRVSGATGSCSPETFWNDYYGVKDTSSLGGDLVNIYEGLVEATSHIIERVAGAL